MNHKIITIGIAPSWDRTIEIAGIDWNQHKTILSQKIRPAGKALNINTALAWMGVNSTAAGLWGSEDYNSLVGADLCVCPKINIRLTKVIGRTRENITIVDTANKRQMHFRSKSTLAAAKSLKLLKKDLQKIITKNSLAVFAGAMPDTAVDLIELAKKKKALVVVDTSGPALKKIVSKGGLFLIKPNIEELGEIVGKKIKNTEAAIISASKKLLTKSKLILVSRGEKGAILLFNPLACQQVQSRDSNGAVNVMSLRGLPAFGGSKTEAISVLSARYTGKKYDVCNTVACGDYLLAGFIKSYLAPRPAGGFVNSLDNLKRALQTAITSASAKAFGLNEKLPWQKLKKKLKVNVY